MNTFPSRRLFTLPDERCPFPKYYLIAHLIRPPHLMSNANLLYLLSVRQASVNRHLRTLRYEDLWTQLHWQLIYDRSWTALYRTRQFINVARAFLRSSETGQARFWWSLTRNSTHGHIKTCRSAGDDYTKMPICTRLQRHSMNELAQVRVSISRPDKGSTLIV